MIDRAISSTQIMIKLGHYFKVRRNHKRPLRFIVPRALVRSGLCTRMTIPQTWYRLRFYPSSLSEQLWVDHCPREPDLQLICTYLRSGDRVIDVGVSVGDTVLTSAQDRALAGVSGPSRRSII